MKMDKDVALTAFLDINLNKVFLITIIKAGLLSCPAINSKDSTNEFRTRDPEPRS
jgi:hypothetical protein